MVTMPKNPCITCQFLHCRERCDTEMMKIDFMCPTPKFQFRSVPTEAESGLYGIILEDENTVSLYFSKRDADYLTSLLGRHVMFKYYTGEDFQCRFTKESLKTFRKELNTVHEERFYSIRDFFYTIIRYCDIVLHNQENCLLRKEIIWNSELVV